MPDHHPDCDGSCAPILLEVSISAAYAYDANNCECLPDSAIIRMGARTARLRIRRRCWLMELLSRSDFEADTVGRDPDAETRGRCRAAGRAFTAIQKAANAASIDIGRWATGGPGRPPQLAAASF